jgi:ribosome maturation factor RimP
MDLTADIERLINPSVESMGFRVVRVKLFTRPRRTLQVMAERADGSPVIVDECARISRVVSDLLDVEDPIGGAYDLEVSSTGIDRPLVKLADYERFAGYVANVTVEPKIDGRRRFSGRLAGVEDGHVSLDLEDGRRVRLPFEAISDAKLALTDELLAAAAPTTDHASA